MSWPMTLWRTAILPAALVGIGLVVGGVAAALAETGGATSIEPAPLQAGQLHTAIWKAQAFGRSVGGGACWLSGPDGALRIEAASAGVANRREDWLPLLLLRSGDGWTFTHSGVGEGTLNQWGQEWRPAPMGLTRPSSR